MSEEYIINGLEPLAPLPTESLGETIFKQFKENSNQEMINISTGESISYGQLLERTCKLANALKNSGIRHNDIISICSENSLYFFQPVIAAFYLGAITVPISFLYTPGEILHILSITKPKIIFSSKNCLGNILQIKNDIPFIQRIIVLDDDENNMDTLEMFINTDKTFKLQNFKPLMGLNTSEQLAVILSSSGTTGLPKGVMITHKNIQVRISQMRDSRLQYQGTSVEVLVVLPLFHSFGFMSTMGFLANSFKIILLSKFEEKLYLSTVEKYKIASLWIPPTVVVFLAKSPLVSKYDLSSIREITSGAAALKKDVEEAVKTRLNVPVIRQGYGLTESTLAVLLMRTNETKPGSVGKVVPFMKAKVVDPETGKTLGSCKNGELLFKGDLITKGYYGNKAATAVTFDEDGWLHTGDVGYYDEDGFFFIVDRLKELIKYKGFQVPPAELEKILVNHPNILEAGVVGIPDDEAGEVPLAFAVKQPNVKLTEKEVQDFVASQVSPQKRLRGGVIFTKELPKTAVGKIIRGKLREMAKHHKSKL